MAGRTSNTQFNSLRRQRELERDRGDISSLGKIYIIRSHTVFHRRYQINEWMERDNSPETIQ